MRWIGATPGPSCCTPVRCCRFQRPRRSRRCAPTCGPRCGRAALASRDADALMQFAVGGTAGTTWSHPGCTGHSPADLEAKRIGLLRLSQRLDRLPPGWTGLLALPLPQVPGQRKWPG